MFDGDVEATFDDPRLGATPDHLRIHRAGGDRLQISYIGVTFEPHEVQRVATSAPALGPWDRQRTYAPAITRRTNAEMTAIFDADQADRGAENIEWSVVGPADAKRAGAHAGAADVGALNSGNNYYHAVFVFQHGGTPEEYLKAHLLATIAAPRGKGGGGVDRGRNA